MSEHTHQFSVDASCFCGLPLSDYVRQLTARTSQLERLVIVANEQTRKQEARADGYRQATIEALQDCLDDPEPLVSMVQFLRALEHTHKEAQS